MYLDQLTVALKNKYDTEMRDGIHVTDLTLCSRKSVFRKLQPTALTMKELNFFTSGRAIHEAIQSLCDPDKFEIEKEVKYNGVTGHVDLYDIRNNIPIECKSMRVAKVENPKSFHVEQVKDYMAMLGSSTGVILYQCLMNFNDKPFVEFEVHMTQKEIDQRLADLGLRSRLHQKALDKKDAMLAPYVLKDPNMNWLCVNRNGTPNCPYYDKCKEADQNKT